MLLTGINDWVHVIGHYTTDC